MKIQTWDRPLPLVQWQGREVSLLEVRNRKALNMLFYFLPSLCLWYILTVFPVLWDLQKDAVHVPRRQTSSRSNPTRQYPLQISLTVISQLRSGWKSPAIMMTSYVTQQYSQPSALTVIHFSYRYHYQSRRRERSILFVDRCWAPMAIPLPG